jgi:hypothetical protein
MERATDHPEWVTTVAFYKAVHVVEAVFAHHLNRDSNSHDSRIESLKVADFKPIFGAFRALYGASLVARYLEDSSSRKYYDKPTPKIACQCFTDFCPPDKVIGRFVKKRLDAIEQNAVGFLSETGRAALLRIGAHLL